MMEESMKRKRREAKRKKNRWKMDILTDFYTNVEKSDYCVTLI